MAIVVIPLLPVRIGISRRLGRRVLRQPQHCDVQVRLRVDGMPRVELTYEECFPAAAGNVLIKFKYMGRRVKLSAVFVKM